MIAGGCNCGACRFELALAQVPAVYACHCHQCQRWSGSAFSLQAIVPEDVLSITGPVVVYEKTTEDRVSTQRICGTCHARLYNTNTRRPGLAIVRAGTLDDSEVLQCRAHIFTDFRQRWIDLPADVPQWGGAAPPDDFIAAMTL